MPFHSNNKKGKTNGANYMGLRSRISLYLVGLLSVLSAMLLLLMHWQGQHKTAQLDEVEARLAMQRLMTTLQASTLAVDGALKTWAYRSDLADYFAGRLPVGRAKDISVEALAFAGVDFLGLTDLSGLLQGILEVPGVDGAKPMTDELRDNAHLYPAYVKASPNASGCGAYKVKSQIALVCFSPTLSNDHQGRARNHIVLGKWLTEEMLREISMVTGVQFDLQDVSTPPLTARFQAVKARMFNPEDVQISVHDEDLQLQTPMVDIFGRHIADARVTWFRRITEYQDNDYRTTRALMILLVLVSGAILMVLLDKVVVKRLNLLRSELATIVDSQHWAGDVSVRGEDELASLARYTRELVAIVRNQVDDLKEQSQTDPLTGLPNRRAFTERLEHTLALHARQQLPAALILIDVDFFKKYNDAYGHPAGDEALKNVALSLRTALRRDLDMPARLGGEEFGVLLQGASAEQAGIAAENIRSCLQAMALPHRDNPPLGVMTMSLGVTVVQDGDDSITLYRRADQALYDAKAQGRNRVRQA